MVLGCAVCAFVVVILCHRTFVHREDIASITRQETNAMCTPHDVDEGGYGLLGMFGEGRGVSMFSIVVQLVRTPYTWMVTDPSTSIFDKETFWSAEKPIPSSCLKSIPG